MEGRFMYGDEYPVPEEHLDEKWKDVKGWPGYAISDHGRLWSEKSQRILKPKRMDREGHTGYLLGNCRGMHEYAYAHRLTAEAFLPKGSDSGDVVRHLDNDPSYNNIDNLAWGTAKDNVRDCIESGRFYYITDEDRRVGLKKVMKPVCAIESDGNELYFESQTDAARELGVPQGNVNKVLRGKRKSAGGYSFRWAGDSI